ncbi:ATPase domain-containing protein [Methanocella sp. MCL-LM]|uniref:ATPase domain-containing protein n=1 Tax=Methanocella sp. MCL-LM TaxID=3412035 RepID=UPI003C7209F8
MIRTGIQALDEYLKGGIPTGKTLLYFSESGAPGDVFCLQTVYASLVENCVCYYVATNSFPNVVRDSFREYGWDLLPYQSHFAVVDGYSGLVGVPSEEQFQIEDPGSIDSVDETISSIIDILSPGDMIVLPSLSAVFDNCRNANTSEADILERVKKWNKLAVLNGGVVLYSFTDRDYDRRLVEQIKSGLCNATVVIGSAAGKQLYKDYFKLYTCDWTRPPEWPILYKIMKPGGVWVYIPKILVTGPHASGKSTFVRTASLLSSGKAVSVDRFKTTVAMDYAHLSLRGFSVDLFGTPGQSRFDPLVRTLARDAMGVILVIDSTTTEGFERAMDIVRMACGKTTPYIVAANKQDLADAMEIDYIRKKMGLPASVPVIGTVALDPGSVISVIETLIDRIVGGV